MTEKDQPLTVRSSLSSLRAEVEEELVAHLVPYWTERTVDNERGGFVGQIDGANVVHPHAAKGVVLNARLLWTFSAVALEREHARCAILAERAFGYMTEHFRDDRYGGVYWMLDCAGRVIDSRKKTYAQAFALYGLSEYYALTSSTVVLKQAIELFELLERYVADAENGGYFEVYTDDWHWLAKERLSPKDPVAAKSSNTLLHLVEAYSRLYSVWPSLRLHSRLVALIRCFLDTIINSSTHHMAHAFDELWRPVSGVISFGHDIEAAWLLTRAAEVTGDADLLAETRSTAVRMAEATLAHGVDADGGLFDQMDMAGSLNDDKHWWPQAEAVVGFLNAYEICADERFVQAAMDTWSFIKHAIIDPGRQGWFFRVDRAGRPYSSENKVGPWNCPYHNVRMCLEVMTRVDRMTTDGAGSPD